MAKKSLGSNPLGNKAADPHLLHVIQGGAPEARPEAGPAALVLSGRGAEAAFEVGVVSALAAKDGFDAKVLTGISLGGLNGAILAAHGGTLAEASARLRGIWLDRMASESWTGRNGLFRYRGDVRSFLNPTQLPGAVADLVGDGSHWLKDAFRHGARMVRAEEDLAARLLWFADLSSFLSLEPLAGLVRDVVDLKAVRRSARRLRIATADWVSGRVEIHEGSGLEGQAGHDRIVAAAARPGLFPCVEIGGTPQVDAAPFAGSPLSAALDAGAGELHVPVFLSTRADDDRPTSTVDALDRMLAEFQIARLQRELTELRSHSPRPLAIHVYRGRLGPAQSHGFLDLRKERVRSLIEHGRQVATKHDCRESGCLLQTAAPAR